MRQLWIILNKRGWSFGELGEALGKKRGIVNKWLWGDRLPDVASAALLESVLGIASRLWAEGPSKPIDKLLPPLARNVLAPGERPEKPARPRRPSAEL